MFERGVLWKDTTKLEVDAKIPPWSFHRVALADGVDIQGLPPKYGGKFFPKINHWVLTSLQSSPLCLEDELVGCAVDGDTLYFQKTHVCMHQLCPAKASFMEAVDRALGAGKDQTKETEPRSALPASIPTSKDFLNALKQDIHGFERKVKLAELDHVARQIEEKEKQLSQVSPKAAKKAELEAELSALKTQWQQHRETLAAHINPLIGPAGSYDRELAVPATPATAGIRSHKWVIRTTPLARWRMNSLLTLKTVFPPSAEPRTHPAPAFQACFYDDEFVYTVFTAPALAYPLAQETAYLEGFRKKSVPEKIGELVKLAQMVLGFSKRGWVLQNLSPWTVKIERLLDAKGKPTYGAFRFDDFATAARVGSFVQPNIATEFSSKFLAENPIAVVENDVASLVKVFLWMNRVSDETWQQWLAENPAKKILASEKENPEIKRKFEAEAKAIEAEPISDPDKMTLEALDFGIAKEEGIFKLHPERIDVQAQIKKLKERKEGKRKDLENVMIAKRKQNAEARKQALLENYNVFANKFLALFDLLPHGASNDFQTWLRNFVGFLLEQTEESPGDTSQASQFAPAGTFLENASKGVLTFINRLNEEVKELVNSGSRDLREIQRHLSRAIDVKSKI